MISNAGSHNLLGRRLEEDELGPPSSGEIFEDGQWRRSSALRAAIPVAESSWEEEGRKQEQRWGEGGGAEGKRRGSGRRA